MRYTTNLDSIIYNGYISGQYFTEPVFIELTVSRSFPENTLYLGQLSGTLSCQWRVEHYLVSGESPPFLSVASRALSCQKDVAYQ